MPGVLIPSPTVDKTLFPQVIGTKPLASTQAAKRPSVGMPVPETVSRLVRRPMGGHFPLVGGFLRPQKPIQACFGRVLAPASSKTAVPAEPDNSCPGRPAPATPKTTPFETGLSLQDRLGGSK